MRRRGFLGILAALALSRPLAKFVPKAIKRRLQRVVIVGGPGADCQTISEAWDRIEVGGTIYVNPGRYENHGPL